VKLKSAANTRPTETVDGRIDVDVGGRWRRRGGWDKKKGREKRAQGKGEERSGGDGGVREIGG